MASLTREELAALSEVVAAMTPGPWTYEGRGGVAMNDGRRDNYEIQAIPPDARMTRLFVGTQGNLAREREPDARGIVALVNAAPALIALAERGLDAYRESAELRFRLEKQKERRKELEAQLSMAEKVIDDLHACIDKKGWDDLSPETRQFCLDLHTKLHHGGKP